MRRQHKLLAGGGAVVSLVLFYMTQISMLVGASWSWSSFRTYFYPDQLSNFAVVMNVAQGRSSAVEPFTATGTMNDPHFYLQLLGAISRWSGIAPLDMWNLGGITVQAVLVMFISAGAVLITRRWWASYFGVVPFVIGTLATGVDGWFTPMKSHAVLWGAFGSMFALNEASAALAISGSIFILFLIIATRTNGRRSLLVGGLIVGAGVGLLANIDTYSFFTALFFSLYTLSVFAMATNGRWWPAIVSILLMVLLFLVGPPFATHVGRLDAIVLGLVPALPGIAIGVKRWRFLVIGPIVATLAAADPQLIGVAVATRDGNTFLKFRQEASVDLGVSWQSGLIGALPLLIPLLMILAAGIHLKQPLWIAYSTGSISAWFIVAKNDAWGTNQEPYQFWIDSFAIIAFTIIPIFIDVGISFLSPKNSQSKQQSRSWKVLITVLLTATIGLGAFSTVDWLRFYKSQERAAANLVDSCFP